MKKPDSTETPQNCIEVPQDCIEEGRECTAGAASLQPVLNARLRNLIDLLPKHRWQVKPAAIEAGYSPSYAQRLPTLLKNNVYYHQALEQKRREVQSELWNTETWRDETQDALERARDRVDGSTELGLLKLKGQSIGVFKEDNQQRAQQFGMIIM